MKKILMFLAALLPGLASAQNVAPLGPGAPPGIPLSVGIFHASNALTGIGYGDSITANAGTGQNGIPCTSATVFCQAAVNGSHLTWVQYYTGQRAYIPPAYNCGESGDTVTMMAARISCVLSYHPDFVIMEIGTNDAAGNTSCASFTTQLRAVIQQLRSAGITVFHFGTFPRSLGFTFTTAQANLAQCYNQQSIRYASEIGNAGYYFIPVDSVMVDPTNTSAWTQLAGQTADGVHPSMVGGSAIGWLVAQQINAVIPQWRQPIYSAADVYDATNNPYGNLSPNGLLIGSGGTVTSGCTGSAPNSTSVFNTLGGATCVASVSTTSDGRPTATITLSGVLTGTNLNVYFVQALTTSNFSAGDTVEGSACVNIGANTNISGAEVRIISTENSVAYGVDSGIPAQTILMPAAGWATGAPVCMWTPRRTLLATPSTLFLEVVLFPENGTAQAVAGAMTVTSMAVRKVAN